MYKPNTTPLTGIEITELQQRYQSLDRCAADLRDCMRRTTRALDFNYFSELAARATADANSIKCQLIVDADHYYATEQAA